MSWAGHSQLIGTICWTFWFSIFARQGSEVKNFRSIKDCLLWFLYCFYDSWLLWLIIRIIRFVHDCFFGLCLNSAYLMKFLSIDFIIFWLILFCFHHFHQHLLFLIDFLLLVVQLLPYYLHSFILVTDQWNLFCFFFNSLSFFYLLSFWWFPSKFWFMNYFLIERYFSTVFRSSKVRRGTNSCHSFIYTRSWRWNNTDWLYFESIAFLSFFSFILVRINRTEILLFFSVFKRIVSRGVWKIFEYLVDLEYMGGVMRKSRVIFFDTAFILFDQIIQIANQLLSRFHLVYIYFSLLSRQVFFIYFLA